MKLRIYLFLILLICLDYSTNAAIRPEYADTLYATRLRPYGRYTFNGQNELELISSAAHFGFKFRGKECTLYASSGYGNGHNYIQYELDGVYQQRIRINGHSNDPVVIKTNDSTEHTIWIYKATEAHTGPVLISKIAGGHIKSISVPQAPLIEFIGNSITCGAAADTADVPCGAGEYQDQHNAYMAYGPRVARDLGLNYILSSVSGIGIYRTWNTESSSMPQVYENIDFKMGTSKKWKFSTYSPKIVSIALGTNDMSNGDGQTPRKPFEEQVFIANYVRFVKLVKSKYPKAQIALLSSPMIKGTNAELLEKCLQLIKSRVDSIYPSGSLVETFFFPPMDAHGCSGHPSVAEHLILARQLKPFYQRLLK